MRIQRKVIIFLVILTISACSHTQPLEQQTTNSTEQVGMSSEAKAKDEYFAKRDALLKKDSARRFDAGVELSDKEKEVNQFLKNLRNGMTRRYSARYFIPTENPFFKSKADIESSELLKILEKMPKGGLLHVHSYAAGDMYWIVKDALSRPDCYVYWYEDNNMYVEGQLGFYKSGKEPAGYSEVKVVAVVETYFDQKLYGTLIFDEDDASKDNISAEFDKCKKRIDGYLSYKPVFTDYYRAALEGIMQDNVQYVELRFDMTSLYDLDGNTYSVKDAVGILWQIRNEFKEKHPDFDFKLILASSRFKSVEDVRADIEKALEIKKAYPDFVIGFDIAGEEDKGNPTQFYLDNFLALSALENTYGVKLPLFLHGGESLLVNNTNLYDAYLLQTKRIGGGLNLYNFPALEEAIIKEDIPLELTPISNQMLGYTKDLRTHPAGGYLRRGVQSVISSDTPGYFGYTKLSFDFWEAFMAWDIDLKSLKKLAINSIEHSGMNATEKSDALKVWQKNWDGFIDWTYDEYINLNKIKK